MIINGEKIAKTLIAKISTQVSKLARPPGLAVILVGDDPASKVYVRNKDRACKSAGFYVEKIQKPFNTSNTELLLEIERLNNADYIDGILLQLPLPKGLHTNSIIEAINPAKDVDGFHSENIGKLMQNKAFLRPCTPKGIMTLLDHIKIDLVGKHAVIVGASKIVGRPMAIELLNAGATITVCNSKTQNLPDKIKQADILVSAVGIAEMIVGAWIKPDSTVIDVGINRLNNGKLVGDIEFATAQKIAAHITPVPGGVGPMTVATLLENTLIAQRARE